MVKVFVGRVPAGLSQDRLREMFEKFGTVTECQTVKDYAFVHMDSESAAESAIKAYHNLSLEGGTLTVEKSHGRPAKAKTQDRNGGGRAGSSGGRDSARRDDRRDSGAGGRYRDRSPIDRRRDDYGRGDYARGGSYGSYDRGGSYGSRGGGYGDAISSYGDRGYGTRAPGGYDSRPPAPSSYGYTDPYARRSPPRYGGGYGDTAAPSYGGGSYGSYSAPPAAGYGSSGYDNYDRYSGGRGYGASAAPAAGVTRRY